MTSRSDRGQAALLVVLIAAALFVSLAAATALIGGRLLDRTRAQTAADAAALGALPGGRGVAELLAERHGGTLVAFARDATGQVRVVVRVGGSTATAAASYAP